MSRGSVCSSWPLPINFNSLLLCTPHLLWAMPLCTSLPHTGIIWRYLNHLLHSLKLLALGSLSLTIMPPVIILGDFQIYEGDLFPPWPFIFLTPPMILSLSIPEPPIGIALVGNHIQYKISISKLSLSGFHFLSVQLPTLQFSDSRNFSPPPQPPIHWFYYSFTVSPPPSVSIFPSMSISRSLIVITFMCTPPLPLFFCCTYLDES